MLLAFLLQNAEPYYIIITSEKSQHNWLCGHLLPIRQETKGVIDPQKGSNPYIYIYIGIKNCCIAKRMLYNLLYNIWIFHHEICYVTKNVTQLAM